MQMDDKIAFGNNILEQLAYHHRQGRDLSIPKHIVPCYYSLNNFEQFLKENLIIFHIDKDDFYILSRKKYKRILAENPYVRTTAALPSSPHLWLVTMTEL